MEIIEYDPSTTRPTSTDWSTALLLIHTARANEKKKLTPTVPPWKAATWSSTTALCFVHIALHPRDALFFFTTGWEHMTNVSFPRARGSS